jgi:hypothetical protein
MMNENEQNPVSRLVVESGNSATSKRQLARAKELFGQFLISRKPQWGVDSLDNLLSKNSHDMLVNPLVWSEFGAFMIDYEKALFEDGQLVVELEERMNYKFNTIIGLLSAAKTYCSERSKKSDVQFWKAKWYTQLRANIRTEMTKKAIQDGKPLVEKSKGLGPKFLCLIIKSYIKRMAKGDIDPHTGECNDVTYR